MQEAGAHADAAAKTSIFRAFVIRVSVKEQSIDRNAMIPIRSKLLLTAYKTTIEQSGSSDVTVTVTAKTIAINVDSSYLYIPAPSSSDMGR